MKITVIRFWCEVGDYLKDGGRIRTVFYDVGDMDYFYSLAKDNGYVQRLAAKDTYASCVRIHVSEFRAEQ